METTVQTERTYRGYTIGGPIPGVRTHHGVFMPSPPDSMPAQFTAMVRAGTEAPFVGITVDGNVVEGVYPLEPSGVDNSAVVAAAQEFLDALDHKDQRMYVQQPVDHWQRRAWFNGSPLWMPEGILIEDLSDDQRDLALEIARHALGETGYELMRNVMRATEYAGEVWHFYQDTLREYAVWITIWGEPNNEGRPWGFQFSGLHVVINALYVQDQLVLEPYFFGAELKIVEDGPHAGLQLFTPEEDVALELGASLTADQRGVAVTYPSIKIADLPPERAGFIDGRQVVASGRDNAVVPYEGILYTDLNADQQGLLVKLLDVYLTRFPEGHRDQRRAQIHKHLEETYISWIGDPTTLPFYYRIQSPSVVIEYDNHPGLGFAQAPEAIPEHVHSLMRMPNGGDYGFALLGQLES